ncbi:hypothetical protein J2Z40_001760 [Cytobacillus eiseniae]|uniref:Uncharacterized protein n=1 Tax=Cytobacillus eiseniae TaxID=762947 RepID=A0ABS4RE62_9BACI|nr:hypothetical protein [Cytobacillus eiseniae]
MLNKQAQPVKIKPQKTPKKKKGCGCGKKKMD